MGGEFLGAIAAALLVACGAPPAPAPATTTSSSTASPLVGEWLLDWPDCADQGSARVEADGGGTWGCAGCEGRDELADGGCSRFTWQGTLQASVDDAGVADVAFYAPPLLASARGRGRLLVAPDAGPDGARLEGELDGWIFVGDRFVLARER